MKKLFIISLTAGILVGSIVRGQQTNTFLNGVIRSGTNVTGTCQSGGLYIHRTSGALYNCPSSTHVWTLLGSGGGSSGVSDTFCVDTANDDTCFQRGSSSGFIRLYSVDNSASNTFAIKNGSSAEFGAIGWSGNTFVIGTQGGVNSGTARDTVIGSAAGSNGVYLATEATSRWQISSTGHFLPFVNNTYDIGSSSKLIRVLYGSDFQNGTGSIVVAGGNCTNQAVTSIAARTGVPTCTTLTSAYTSGLATTAGDLSQFASTTSAQLAGVISNETGSGALVFGTSPSLTTPSLGVATATSINGLTITTTTGTFTLANAKTFVVNNGLTLSGTDGTTMTFPSTSATIARTDAANTFTGVQTMTSPVLTTPSLGVATATSINGNTFTTGTYTLTGAAGKTLTFNNSLTLAGTDSTTMTFPSTSATIARTDAANTFTGNQTITEVAGGSGLIITGATQTTSQPALNITQTWNASGTTFTFLKGNVTNTASASGSILVDLQVGGTSRFSFLVGSTSVFSIDGTAASNNAYALKYGSSGVATVGSYGGTSEFAVSGLLAFQNGTNSTPDAVLARSAAGQIDVGSTADCSTASRCRDLRLRHLIGGGTAPTVASTTSNSCGTTSPTIAGTDSAGKITVGATSGTSCTITFGTAYSNAPSCWGNDETTAGGVTKIISTTTTVILSGTFLASDVINYGCIGY